MDFIPFNSQFTYHKTPFGAVKSGTAVTLRIILRKSFHCTTATLKVKSDGGNYADYPMQWEKNEGDHEEWWKVKFTPTSSGLYFYHFTFHNKFGENKIAKTKYPLSAVTNEGEDYQLTVYDEDFSTPDDFKGGVIYQIFPDRFARGSNKKFESTLKREVREDWGGEPNWNPDENGNISEYDFFMGDFKGIEQKLDYIESLGVNTIYLNPIFSAMSNHRYDTADYETTDCFLGSNRDFSLLCKKAKEKNIKIILDGVFSHTGSDSKYFNKNKTYGDGGAYNDKNSPYYSWYKFTEYPDKYKCWWGVDILPEIDEENDSYIDYIKTILRKWLKLGASGWRLDVADELPNKFLDNLRQSVKAQEKNALIIGEVWEDASNKISYSSRRRYLLGKQLDSVMNYPFAETLIRFAITGHAGNFNNDIMQICENYPKCVVDCLMNHIGTHDTCRVINRLGTLDKYNSDHLNRYKGELNDEEYALGKTLLKLVSTLQFTLPGIPSVYYGDEVGLKGGVDPYNRGCYPWGNEDKDLLEHYKLLGKIRKEHPAYIDGEFVPVSSTMGCVAFERRGRGERIFTVANRNHHPIKYTLPRGKYTSLTGQKVEKNKICLDALESAIVILRD